MGSVEYWVRHARDTVRFADGVAGLAETGVTCCLEIGPDAVLTPMVRECLDAPGTPQPQLTPVAAARRGRPETATLLTALAALHVRGVDVAWSHVFDGRGQTLTELPTYPFQRRTFWLDASPGVGDVAAAGLGRVAHPMLGAVLPAPDHDGAVLTGRLSSASQSWLSDHRLMGQVVLPGTAFLELAVRAGDEVGAPVVAELTQEAPLLLPERGGTAVQVTVGPSTPEGRALAIYARPEDASPGTPWTRHAGGRLSRPQGSPAQAASAGVEALGAWPPADAEQVPMHDVYDALAALGYGYGPMFQGMRRVWRRGNEVFAEVSLPEGGAADADAYALHPALLDSAIGVTDFLDGADPRTLTETRIPFAWSGATLHAGGASALRVRVTRAEGGAATILLADPAGVPVLTVRSLATRPVSAAQLEQREGTESLYRITWNAAAGPSVPGSGDAAVPATPGAEDVIATLDPGAEPPPLAWWDGAPQESSDADVPAAARASAHRTLHLLRRWLAEPRLSGTMLAVRTRQAVSTGADDGPPDPAQAPLWGLVRAAQAEHPGRFVLFDTPTGSTPQDALCALPTVIAGGEAESAVRGDALLVPRLLRHPAPPSPDAGWDSDGTVLITGGTGLLAGHLARHLVTRHGVRHLLLASRRGPKTPGAQTLRAELTALGADVSLAACDVADRSALAELIAGIPADRPLTGVVHAAGLLDGAVTQHLTERQLDAALRPKADAAWYLHELTRGLPLTRFVLLSSAGGLILAGGQGNYAAANVFLDALAELRVAEGLPATSLAYGLWEGSGGAPGVDAERLARSGTPELPTAEALALFDAGLASGLPHTAAVRLDTTALAARTHLPALLTALVDAPAPARRSAEPGTLAADTGELAERLAALDEEQRLHTVLDLVAGHVSAVLGHADASAVRIDRGFTDLGLDSLAAIELRNRLAASTGLRLPATLMFDHPTPSALAGFLVEELMEEAGPLDAATAAAPESTTASSGADPASGPAGEDIRSMSADDLITMALNRRGGARTGE